ESILRSLFVARPQSAAVTALFMRATFHASQSGVAAALCHRSTKFPHRAWWPITTRGLPARCPSSLTLRRDRFAARLAQAAEGVGGDAEDVFEGAGEV